MAHLLLILFFIWLCWQFIGGISVTLDRIRTHGDAVFEAAATVFLFILILITAAYL